MKLTLLALDAAVVVTAMWLGYALTSRFNDLPVARHAVLGGVAVPTFLLVISANGLYRARRISSAVDEARRVLRAVPVGLVVVACVDSLLALDVSRVWLITSAGLVLVLLLLERAFVRSAFGRMRDAGRFLRPVIIVGANAEGLALAEMLTESPRLGYRVEGFLDDDPTRPTGMWPMIGGTLEALSAVERTGASGVIVATTGIDLQAMNWLTRRLTEQGIHVELSSSLQDIAAKRLSTRALGRFAVTYVQPVLFDGWRAVAKRAFDIVVATTVLVCGMPVLAAVAVAVKLDSRGPVLFRQRRVGRDGEEFFVAKFRTMAVDAEERIIDLRDQNEADGPLFKIRNDPRVTRVGKFLRKTSLDELPQMFNVLLNDMSIVGPRPALPSEVLAWHPELFPRLRVKPGITGMWQVSGRSQSTFETYMRLDLYYVDNWSLATDLAIVAKTIPTVLLQRGAY